MAELSDRHDRSELIAVLPIPADDPGRQQSRPDLCVVVIDRPGLPGTLGSLLRSIDALGGHGLIVVGHAADVYDPEVIRASTGSFFAVPVVQMERVPDVLAWRDSLRGALGDVPLIGAAEDGAVDADAHPLSRAFLAACDHVVRIPMHGSASSLNVAAAGSVLRYEVGRQRRAGHST
ncbi:TrmH family RNA methyltransferase [Deinococcus metalli]